MKKLQCKCFLQIIVLVFLLILPLLGCMQKQVTIVGEPSLADRYDIPLTQMGDDELKGFLDEAYEDPYNRKDFWEPMMGKLLHAKIDEKKSPRIPRKHIKYFLKEFSENQETMDIYDQAVWLWYKSIINDESEYRTADKVFLEGFINSCITDQRRGGACRAIAENITIKLDKCLYETYFGKNPLFSKSREKCYE